MPRQDVTKGALHYHFENKDALGYAVVDEVITDLTHKKWLRPLEEGENPIDALIDRRGSINLAQAGRRAVRLRAE